MCRSNFLTAFICGLIVLLVDLQSIAQCNQPYDAVLDNITETMVDLSWTMGGNCVDEARYWVTTATSSDVSFSSGTIISCTPSFPITASGLTKATDYYVYAYEDCGSSSTGIINIGAFTTEDYCPKIVDASFSGITDSSVDITWDPGILCEDGMEYWVQTTNDIPLIGTGTTISCDVTFPISVSSLTDSTDYFVFVYKDCGMGNSTGPDQVGSFITLEYCSEISDGEFENITSNSFDLSWDPGSSCLTGMEYWVRDAQVIPPIGTGTSVDCNVTFPIAITGLEVATDHYVYVYKDCGAGESTGPTYLGMVTTAIDCIAPEDLVVDNISETMADLSWTLGGECVDEAKYWVRTSSATPTVNSSGSNLITCNPSFPILHEGLNPGTEYFVFAYEDCGGSNFSPVALLGDFTTLNPCPAPDNFSSEVTDVTAVLNWTMGDSCTSESKYWIQPEPIPPTLGVGGTEFDCDADLPISLTGLSDGSTYYVYVYKACEDGNSTGPLQIGSFTTICPASSDLVADNITGLMAELSWSMGGGSCINDPEYWVSSTSTPPTTTSVGQMLNCVPDFPITQTGLDPLTQYFVFSKEYCHEIHTGPILVGNFTTTDDTLFTFSSASSNLWSDPNNWNQAVLPGVTDTVIIQDANPTIDVDVSVSALTLINSVILLNPGVIFTILNDED